MLSKHVHQFGYLYKQYTNRFIQANYVVPLLRIPHQSYSIKERGISDCTLPCPTIMEWDENRVPTKVNKCYSTLGYRPTPIKMENPPAIMTQICELMKAKGHSCMTISGMTEHKFEWCQKEICPETQILNDMRRRNDEQEALIFKLKNGGHVCISIKESYPIQVGWCQETPCKHIVSNEKSIPELTKEHNLESCYGIGSIHCFKTIAILDVSLKDYARMVVYSTWPLVEIGGDKEIIRRSLGKEITMDLDKSQFLWQARLKSLVENGVITIEPKPFQIFLSEDTQKRILSDNNSSKESVNDILRAIANINTIIRNRCRVLYRLELDDKWPFL